MTNEKKKEKIAHALTWNKDAFTNKFILKPVYWSIPLILWTLLVLASYVHNVGQIQTHIEDMAANKARFIFSMIQDMRLWNARHGGVYVKRTEQSPSNPYLVDVEKDVTTDMGHELTKLNPAYMTRQIAAVIREQSNTMIHITSLDPINQDNVADEWETNALRDFEKRTRESYDFLDLGKIKLFRYMAPLITQQACLACHSHQGYKVGDVRGGISVSFDSSPFLNAQNMQIVNQRTVHMVTWILLCTMTVFALAGLRHHISLLITARDEQEAIVEARTSDLREESRKRHEAQAQFRRFIDSSGEGIIAMDELGVCTFANRRAAEFFGLKNSDMIVGRHFNVLNGHHNYDGTPVDFNVVRRIQTGKEICSDSEFFKRADGTPFPVEYVFSPVFEDRKIIGAVVSFSDISERKEHESTLTKLSIAVAQSPAATLITDKDGVIEYVNKRFLEITGYSEEEVIGNTPSLLKSGHTPEAVYSEMWHTLNDGEPWHGELLNKKKDGTLFWEETLISPIQNKYGEVTHFVSVKRDITGYKSEMDEAWRQANFDTLTKLPNRNLFEDRLENAIALAHREDRNIGLLFIDLDGFKEINDTFGHDAGDHVLKVTAQRLQASLRHSDTAARLGGDEFVIIVQDAQSINAIENVAQKIIDEVAQEIDFHGNSFKVSASIGISVMPRDAKNAKDLLRFADVAMYGAKQRGKNGFCHYETFLGEHGKT